MKQYKLEVAISKVYLVEVFADNELEAQDIVDDIDPSEHHRSSEFIEVRRDYTAQDEQDVTDYLTEHTGFMWDEVPTGGGCTAYEADTEWGFVRITDAESAQVPTAINAQVSVIYEDTTTSTTSIIGTYEFCELLNPATLASVTRKVEEIEQFSSVCRVCLLPTLECQKASASAKYVTETVSEMMRHTNTATSAILSDLLTAYRIHAIPTCNTESMA